MRGHQSTKVTLPSLLITLLHNSLTQLWMKCLLPRFTHEAQKRNVGQRMPHKGSSASALASGQLSSCVGVKGNKGLFRLLIPKAEQQQLILICRLGNVYSPYLWRKFPLYIKLCPTSRPAMTLEQAVMNFPVLFQRFFATVESNHCLKMSTKTLKEVIPE